MTVQLVREALRSRNPFKITMAGGQSVDLPHPEFAMISGTGRILYVAAPKSDAIKAFDVLLITSLEQKGKLPA
jgi:hypothetical protein